MHEDLLGYLLGALEPHEMERVAQMLRDDPAAREELERIEASLKPLEDNYQPVEPPPSDLVERTLASLPPLPPMEPVDGEASLGVEAGDALDAAIAGAGPEQNGVGPEQDGVSLAPMQDAVEGPKNPSAAWVDWASGAVAGAVLLGLLLPSLAQGRMEARKTQCQDNLRQQSTSITEFVNRDAQHRLPAVAQEGPEAFAGVYAMRLREAGLLPNDSVRWCPTNQRPEGDAAKLVSLQTLRSAGVDKLREYQRFAGGHYAFTLGVIDQDGFRPPKFESRSSFAIMSDAPLTGVSSDGKVQAERIGHGGYGINVLFEDGRVEFIALESLDSMRDHPLLNHRGQVEAGVNVDDATLAPSWYPPFIEVKQR